MKTTIVKNVITEKKETYYNNLDLDENLISSIISLNNQNSNLLNRDLRKKYSFDVEKIHSKKNSKVMFFAPKYDLIAYHQE